MYVCHRHCLFLCLGLHSSISQVSKPLIEKYAEAAKKLVEERGAVDAMAAALAVIAGETASTKDDSVDEDIERSYQEGERRRSFGRANSGWTNRSRDGVHGGRSSRSSSSYHDQFIAGARPPHRYPSRDQSDRFNNKNFSDDFEENEGHQYSSRRPLRYQSSRKSRGLFDVEDD